ncbi:GNAT family N-acetyltransferase [Rhodococcus chondri]|uniref:GNAT family N-acetyltransferase n=1 Tax=Rhodococcus chondri TaxID=3065941 RepID=A0ABU7JTL4_9NOCA|nr:GNAT family N-acetyltransferase [Rhodococcus sp. CC-R104]MEE2033175.1 GNAT family N-acetyltransferase [Rhodococcus sp. CC-R104]
MNEAHDQAVQVSTGTTIERFRISTMGSGDGLDTVAVAELVNTVYAVAEDGMWADGCTRTNPSEIAEMALSGQLVGAWQGDHLVGCIRVVCPAEGAGENTAEFGMLAAAPQFRGLGVGRELVRFVEEQCAAAGCETMQLEVIRPRDTPLSSKDFLARWYTQLGYRLAATGPVGTPHPELVESLVVPCEVDTYRKVLRPEREK